MGPGRGTYAIRSTSHLHESKGIALGHKYVQMQRKFNRSKVSAKFEHCLAQTRT